MAHIIEACGKQYLIGIRDTQRELCEIIEENMGTEFSKEVQRYIDYIKQVNKPCNKEKIGRVLDLVIEVCQDAWDIDINFDSTNDVNLSYAKKLTKAVDLLWEIYDECAE